MQCCLGSLGQPCIGLLPVECYPKSINAKLHRIFFMQYYMEPLGQYCIGFSAVQCCPKSMKTILHRISSYALLPGASRILLHKVLTCTKLSQEY